MSRYALDKAVREILFADDAALARAQADPAAFAAGRDLTDEEHRALGTLDFRALYALGVHPFLLNMAAMRTWPPLTFFERQQQYVKDIADLGHPDFGT